MEEETAAKQPLVWIAMLLFLVIFLTMGLSVGYAAAEHNHQFAQLVFSEESFPDGMPEGYQKQVLWMREQLKRIRAYGESMDGLDQNQVQSIFYVLFLDVMDEVPDIESYCACFLSGEEVEPNLDIVYERLEGWIGRKITEEEFVNIAELSYRLEHGFERSYDDDGADGFDFEGGDTFIQTDGSFLSPIAGSWRSCVSSEYGVRTDPISGKRKGHAGIDLAIPTGTKVYAVADGTVQSVRYRTTGYGYHVMIQHTDGVVTLYAHCSKLLVREGQEVEKGTVIALSGNTGKSTGPHLHYEVRVDGAAQNPRRYLP